MEERGLECRGRLVTLLENLIPAPGGALRSHRRYQFIFSDTILATKNNGPFPSLLASNRPTSSSSPTPFSLLNYGFLDKFFLI